MYSSTHELNNKLTHTNTYTRAQHLQPTLTYTRAKILFKLTNVPECSRNKNHKTTLVT